MWKVFSLSSQQWEKIMPFFMILYPHNAFYSYFLLYHFNFLITSSVMLGCPLLLITLNSDKYRPWDIKLSFPWLNSQSNGHELIFCSSVNGDRFSSVYSPKERKIASVIMQLNLILNEREPSSNTILTHPPFQDEFLHAFQRSQFSKSNVGFE